MGRLYVTSGHLRDTLWCVLFGLLPLPAAFGGVLNRFQIDIPCVLYTHDTRCYDELGCLRITKSWYDLKYRPLNCFPLQRSDINTRFLLFTKKNPNEEQIMNVNVNKTIVKSNFNPLKLTKMIIHGFLDTPLSNWVETMKEELKKAGDFNIIVVDWSGGNLPPYTQATANTRLVGLEVAHFIKTLQKYHGLNPLDVHIIGHSLGAHVAGYAGENIQGLGRITGLDPANPYFHGMPAYVRLDPTDGQLVDVIHTDAKSIFLLGYGILETVGHLDFYPNDGKEQPGCDISNVPPTLVTIGLEEAFRVLTACDHIRAVKLFTESINGKCPFIGHQCPSYQQFLEGECFNCRHGCAIMGFHADKSPGLITNKNDQSENEVFSSAEQDTIGAKYFLGTGKELPFCQQHYRIAIQLAKTKDAPDWTLKLYTSKLYKSYTYI